MKLIKVKTPKLKTFTADIDAAFGFLAAMIIGNKNTRFWFGSTDGSITGEISLYINVGDLVRTHDEYEKNSFDDDRTEDFFKLGAEEQREIKEKFYTEIISPHRKFMWDFGNELKEVLTHEQ